MRLNEIKSAEGSRSERRRVGRGIGSGLGKTCGRGHKGQHSRSGGFHKVGFEGGQMPIQRRLPKVGFASKTAGDCAQVFLYQLADLDIEVIDLAALRKANLINRLHKRAKLVSKGEIGRAIKVQGVAVTAGAKAAIEAAGGTVES